MKPPMQANIAAANNIQIAPRIDPGNSSNEDLNEFREDILLMYSGYQRQYPTTAERFTALPP